MDKVIETTEPVTVIDCIYEEATATYYFKRDGLSLELLAKIEFSSIKDSRWLKTSDFIPENIVIERTSYVYSTIKPEVTREIRLADYYDSFEFEVEDDSSDTTLKDRYGHLYEISEIITHRRIYPIDTNIFMRVQKAGSQLVFMDEVKHQEVDKLFFSRKELMGRPVMISGGDIFDYIASELKLRLPASVRIEKYSQSVKVHKSYKLDSPDIFVSLFGRKRGKETKKMEREITVFEMEKTDVPDFVMEREEDLYSLIDTEVDRLVTYLSAPIERCPHCEGTGLVYSSLNPEIVKESFVDHLRKLKIESDQGRE